MLGVKIPSFRGVANRRNLPFEPNRVRGGGLYGRIEDRLQAAPTLLVAELDQRRGFLWAPVIFGVGILVYFNLPSEPHLATLICLSAALWAGALVRYFKGSAGYRTLAVAGLLVSGVAITEFRVERLTGPTLAGPVVAGLRGKVVAVDLQASGRRRLIIAVEHADTTMIPRQVRISLPNTGPLPDPGDRVQARARLFPVSGPVAPGDYSPRRAAFFKGIGASGYLIGDWKPVAGDEKFHLNLRARIQRLRQNLVARIRDTLPGNRGGIAAALLVGERGYMAEADVAALRDSGLAHILAISGLHMGLVAGTVYGILRLILALFPGIALTWPIKKWAAGGALLAGFGYLLLSGGAVSTVRAFVMAAILFGAIIADRPAFSMRNLAIAAFVILISAPEHLLSPGFQMSFATVAALLAFWDYWRSRERLRLSEPDGHVLTSLVRSMRAWIAGIGATTLVAGAATAPIAAYHFQSIVSYSVVGNMLAMPLVIFWVMPAGMLALLTAPLGLDPPVLELMGVGIGYVVSLAEWVAGLPAARHAIPATSPAAFLFTMGALLWACLWKSPIRILGILAWGMGLLIMMGPPEPPNVIVNERGSLVGIHEAGILHISGRGNAYGTARWRKRLGLESDREPGRGKKSAAQTTVRRKQFQCDPAGCAWNHPQWGWIVHNRDPVALFEDCRYATILISVNTLPESCGAPIFIDKAALTRFGAHALWLAVDELGVPTVEKIETAYASRRRPWHRSGSCGANPLNVRGNPLKTPGDRLKTPSDRLKTPGDGGKARNNIVC